MTIPTQEKARGLKLTKQQCRALAVVERECRMYDDGASDSLIWEEAARPWPTMDNLVRKGLVVRESWSGPEDGWIYLITDAGRKALDRLPPPSPDVELA